MKTIWKVTVNDEEPVWIISASEPTGDDLKEKLDIIQDYYNTYETKESLEVKTFKGIVLPEKAKSGWFRKLIGVVIVQVDPEFFLGNSFQPDSSVFLRLEEPLDFSIQVWKTSLDQPIKNLVLSLDE